MTVWLNEVWTVSYTHLDVYKRQKIKGITGLTLNDFILQIKLRKCASLLESSDLTISEITWKAGFSSPGYMGKCFKEYFGAVSYTHLDVYKRQSIPSIREISSLCV